MALINNCTFSVRMGADAEIAYDANGQARLNFRCVVSNRRQDRETREWVDDPMWLRCVYFGRNADKIGPRLLRGSTATIIGKIGTPSIWDSDKGPKIQVEFRANEVHADGKAEESSDGAEPEQAAPRQQQRAPQQQSAAPAQQRRQQPAPADAADLEDLPF